MTEASIRYSQGLPDDQRAAELYNDAFGPKLRPAIGDSERVLALLAASFVPLHAFCAIANGQLVGLAGFHTPEGSLTAGMTYRGLLSHLGLVRGNWAALILSLYERQPAPGQLVMDGIAVRPDRRGHGIGTHLLDEVTGYAAREGYRSVRLDVIDVNMGARRLYERYGFEAVKTERFEYLRWLVGFGGATTMELALPESARQQPD
jgi:ribosomal protein S18 acetylase RimI-like enzyme